MPHPTWRYGPWQGGRDPLESPFDVRRAMDEIGDDVLDGATPADALRRLLRQGSDGLRGLDDLRRRLRQRMRSARNRGRLDGTLEEVQRLLDEALAAERRALFPDPDDAARLAEQELDQLPDDTARAVRQLADYPWRSDEARQNYDKIRDLLRREVLDSQFQGMKDAMQGASAEDMAKVRDMVADLNQMLESNARGQHTQEQFEQFMDKHGEFFPDRPQNLDELIDELARRAAAQQRMMDSLSPQQREELTNLVNAAMADTGLASEMAQLRDQLQAARPDLRWGGREDMRGEQGLGMGDATSVLAELADLQELDATLDQDYPGAGLADVDPELVERMLGRQAVDDLAELRRIERELAEQGYLQQKEGRTTLSAKAVRRIGSTALRRVFSVLEKGRRGDHDVPDAGAAGELTGSSRPWQFGDEQPLDVTRTVRNAVLRGSTDRPVKLIPEDFEVMETERRTSAAVALLIDLSYSMELRGTWSAAKTTAMALHSLVSTRYPQDSIQLIGFSDYARVVTPGDLAELSPARVQGTNLQHALMLAQRHVASHPDSEPVILVVTDGEPTAHLTRSGRAEFNWPPLPETVALTYAEVDRCTRRGATINVFMLDTQPDLVRFVEELASRNGGRVFSPSPDRLGEYVVQDYLRARQGRRAARR